MAKTITHYDRIGLSDSEKKNNQNNTSSAPSEEALRFVLDYAKSSSVVKTNAIDSIVVLNN
ncbi:MAG: hypothetical protein P8I82_03250 [Flavobacteriales bacterium]|nr:hypothetical protein [Flavobacteriales bacterium]